MYSDGPLVLPVLRGGLAGVDNMETMGGFLVFFILVGLVMRVIGGRERARYRGFRTPARFLDFTGKRLKVSSRAQ
jgi:biotin transporter BioY